jgi:hypothetical protein
MKYSIMRCCYEIFKEKVVVAKSDIASTIFYIYLCIFDG